MANELTNRNRTLGELMTELRARLGFVTQGPASQSNDPIIKSFLQEAHEYVFEKLQPPAVRRQAMLNVVAGSFLYDWVNDADNSRIDPGQVLGIWMMDGDDPDYRLMQDDLYQAPYGDDTGRPDAYRTLNGQIQIRPIPDGDYKLLIEYLDDRGRFEQQSDRSSVPDRLVFLLALANAKAHYRHPDSQAAGALFESLLSTHKAKQKENKRYFVGQKPERELQVVRTADGRFVLG